MANVTAFCNECGFTHTANAQGLPIHEWRMRRCPNCKRSTQHVRLHRPGYVDFGESRIAERPLQRYNPAVDLAKRWPGWTFYRMPLVDGAFSFLEAAKVILLDSEWPDGDPWREQYLLAHAVAHLDLHFASVCAGGRLTDKQADEAEEEALRRMEEFMPTKLDQASE